VRWWTNTLAITPLQKARAAVLDHGPRTAQNVKSNDESGADYLYPEEFFVPVKLPPSSKPFWMA
jgi:hypothetical protein